MAGMKATLCDFLISDAGKSGKMFASDIIHDLFELLIENDIFASLVNCFYSA